ncbi:MAG: metallophosphoesterase [Gemmatimonadaceae bacterium]|nr:metallophosphoesterase [Gemmatimonadaceae bacterium]
MPAKRLSVIGIVLPALLISCNGCGNSFGLKRTPPPADAPAAEVAIAGAKVMIGVGDIATCGNSGDEATALLVDSVLRANAAAAVETVVFTLGDHAYPDASDRNLARCFTPSWGDPAKLIMKSIRPSIGNHDYMVQRGAPYYRYFGSRAGDAGKGYYSYDVGEWHVIVLNSELAIEGTVGDRRTQDEWLRDDLQKNRKLCTMAYFHHPLFSSSWRRGEPPMERIWAILYASDVDLVLSGHDHHYERFGPQTPAGAPDTVKGIEQILVGTGGATLRGFGPRFGIRGGSPAANSLIQIQGYFGVLILTLGTNEYRSAFLDTEGRVWDRHGRKCR